MTRKTAVHHPSPYDLLALRIQKQLLNPRSQLERRAIITRMTDESEEAWQQLLEALTQEDALTISHQPDGSIELTWPHPASDW